METFVKDQPPGDTAFAYEAAGLRWLTDGLPDDTQLRVVRVAQVSDDQLELERLRHDAPSPSEAEALGHGLARLHDAGAPLFGAPPAGWEGDGWIGSQPMNLRPTLTWGAMYAEDRVLPYARKAAEVGNLDADGLRAIDALCERIAAGEFDDDAPPARIHGDLWAGNVVWTPDPVLIDPAAHGGHRLTDLAMLGLFGAPHLERVFAAYDEANDHLPDQWTELLDLHQLHPLCVHAVTHDASYGAEASRIAQRYA